MVARAGLIAAMMAALAGGARADDAYCDHARAVAAARRAWARS